MLISVGPHYFKMAILFRNSTLINNMLCRSSLRSHLEKLEQIERIFFRILFEVPDSTAIEVFYSNSISVDEYPSTG